tara:strand:+ start:1965 stop:2354 length:390 start_codon:yes stop_codon:yes gene_type:complete
MVYFKKGRLLQLFFCFIAFVIFFASFSTLSAEQIQWKQVSSVDSEIQFIDINSIKYNKRGWLSVISKSSEINPDDQNILNTNSYLLAIDCDNRLFSKLPVNGDLNQVKDWQKPTDDKLIKNTIINSCSY